MQVKKYVLIGDFLNGRYVTPQQLRKLYKLNAEECVMIDTIREDFKIGSFTNRGLIQLTPLEKGNYEQHLRKVSK